MGKPIIIVGYHILVRKKGESVGEIHLRENQGIHTPSCSVFKGNKFTPSETSAVC